MFLTANPLLRFDSDVDAGREIVKGELSSSAPNSGTREMTLRIHSEPM
jgi:hypothetical protein